MGVRATDQAIRAASTKPTVQEQTPISTDMFIPNYSGVVNHVQAKAEFGNFVFLGSIAGGVTASGATHSLGTISISAGQFKSGDQVFFVVDGYGKDVSATVKITAGGNDLSFQGFSISSVSEVPLGFQGYARQLYSATGSGAPTLGIMHANGAGIATTGSHRVISATMGSDWITGAFTITLLGGGNDVAKSYIKGSFWKVGGHSTLTVVDGDL